MRLAYATAVLTLATGTAFAQGVAPSNATPGAQTPSATMNTTPQTNASPSPSAVQTHTTTSRTAAAPVPGRNSFTESQAHGRITAAGFTDVKGLKKDSEGIWRGEAMKGGSPAKVALDYQGNVVGN
jgi:hypothetical protein